MEKRTKKSLGEILLEQGVISQQQWEKAQQRVKSGESIRKALIKEGAISEEDMVNFIAQYMSIPRIELKNQLIDSKIINLISEDLARKYQLIPVLKIGNTLTCAMIDVFNIMAFDELMHKTGLTVEAGITTEAEMKKALDEHYSVKGDMQDIIEDLEKEPNVLEDGTELELSKLKDLTEEPPVVKLVNMIVMQAVKERASDIHIEPEENELKVRFRVDGVLYEQSKPPKHFQSAIISRIKIIADLDIAERRRPQDGRIQMAMEGRAIDIRVSCVPTIYGENIVLRLLDSSQALLGLDQIGLHKEIVERYRQLLLSASGIILVTGPTGGGKTTTLYSSLNTINSVDKNIITIEDPVEYRLAGIRQIQVNPEIDLTFANGLRSILRQDPDIIMVGEIRDLETAEIAIQAALTGHLVLATLHTNNAPGAITRLMDMGVEPYLISSSLIGVLAQRLVRVLCACCQGKGCSDCHEKGYKGRSGIYELMVLNEHLRELTATKASMDEIKSAAIASGMKTLREDGMKKVEEGITSKEEVMRVSQEGVEL